MDISIGEKLNSSNLFELVGKFWDSSFQSRNVTFDLSDTEWISNSEMVFFIGWINNLIYSNVLVGLQLPRNNGIGNLARKKYFQKKLLLDWKLKKHIEGDIKLYDGGISTDGYQWNSLNEIINIPIIKHSVDTFDKSFEKIYSDFNLIKFSENTKELTSLNHLESKLLNYAITKELYSNTVIHSGLAAKLNCQYSFSVNKKISDLKVNKWNLVQREKELSNLEKHFFLDNGKYRNIDFIEINFQDFGIGIVDSLREKYHLDSELLESFFDDELEIHKSTNEDSQILHYALLLFTSKYEVDKRFEVHDFIPRGLYILQELVAKYQGYLEIFSKKGAIGISYLKGIKQIHFESKNNTKIIFPGTRIRIVFPSKDSIVKFKKSDLKRTFSKDNSDILTINLIELLTKSKFDFIPDNNKKAFENKVTLLSIFFESVSKKLITTKKNSIIVLDFSGLNRRTEDVFLKLLFFITHSPINTNYRIIIVNILAKQLNSVINQSKNLRKLKGLFIYPIPVIYPDLEIDWIGIEDDIFKKELNEIWKQGVDYSKYLVLANIEKYLSNTIIVEHVDKGFNVSVTFPALHEVISKIKVAFEEFILDEINNSRIKYRYLEDHKHNYNKILRKKDDSVYLTSHGSLQSEYISFNNKLYRSEYTRLLVTHLIFQNYACSFSKDLSKVSKILSVTLSSQFLACEIQKVLKEIFPENEAELVTLSNYYEFYKEKRFNDIKPNDKILVINDIISTGRLTETIFDSLEKREADPITCFALVDLRTVEKKLSRFNYPIITLANYNIKRLANIPKDKKVLWINPILNAPVTLKKEKHEINSLIPPEDFLEFIQDKDITIGNIKNNAFYTTYYLKTNELIKREFSKKSDSLFNILFQLLKVRKKKNNLNELSLITRGLNIIKGNLDSDSKKNKINKIVRQLDSIGTEELFFDYNVDLICYPFLSNIQEIEEDIDLFKESGINTTTPKIFPIPRVLTQKGWRFTFPPKFLNILTERINPSILILDDGSSTGNTIMQMIDSIAFLNAKSIDVLSIFGRLEDFKKELLSRLKSIRTKNNVVPLNVFFGVHMNLPVLTESENPFIEEAKEINSLLASLGNNIDDNFYDYLKSRVAKLLDPIDPQKNSCEIPIWETVSKKKMLIYRHKIGKFDSYRLYSEDIINEGSFEFWETDNDSILTLLSVLNLEPNLYKVLKRLIPPDSIQKLVEFCLTLFDKNSLNGLELEFLIKALLYLDTEFFMKANSLIKLIELFKSNNANVESYHFLNLQLLLIAFEIRNIEDVVTKNGALSNIFECINTLKFLDEDLFDRQFRYLNNQLTKLNDSKIGKKEIPINIYRKLQNYFIFALSFEKSHKDKKLEWQLDRLDLAATDLIHSLNNKNNDQELNDFLSVKKEFSKCYFHIHEEYGFIKSILLNLKDYKPKNLNFNPSALYDSIIEFENLLDENETATSDILKNLRDKIRFYKTSILFSNSFFNKFIRLSKTNIEKVWIDCENKYKTEKNYKPINIKTELNFIVAVNSYVMLLAFENLIKNKIQYAKEKYWELEALSTEDNRVVLRFTQFSEFVLGGTGNGQSEIRGFLMQNGVFYKRESIKPNYIIRIDIPKK